MDKKDREMLDERKKRMTPIAYAGLLIAVIGIAFVFASLFSVNTLAIELQDHDHITDDSMAVRDMDNATYTWTNDELLDMLEGDRDMLLIGAGVAAIGIALLMPLLVMQYTPVEAHRRFCKGDDEKLYCPECGLKLSRLEPKK